MYLNVASQAISGRPSWIDESRWFQNAVKIFPLDMGCQSDFVGKVASFAFWHILVQEVSLLMVFNMASAAILGHHFELESQDRPIIQ